MTHYMVTYSGRRFYPDNPRAEDVDILDIAHALGMTCRYGGHVKQFYSVAQHSLLMAQEATPQNKMLALLHDAPEAYLGDVIRPIKHHLNLGDYMRMEKEVERVICEAFGIECPSICAEVKELDAAIIRDEREQLFVLNPEPVTGLRLGVEIIPMSPETCRWAFLAAFERYGGKL